MKSSINKKDIMSGRVTDKKVMQDPSVQQLYKDIQHLRVQIKKQKSHLAKAAQKETPFTACHVPEFKLFKDKLSSHPFKQSSISTTTLVQEDVLTSEEEEEGTLGSEGSTSLDEENETASDNSDIHQDTPRPSFSSIEDALLRYNETLSQTHIFHSESDQEDASDLVYRMSETGPDLLRQVLEEKGWTEYVEGESKYWNFWWKGSRFPTSQHAKSQPYHRLNHFGNTTTLTRKDCLFRLLRTMKGIYGNCYDFFPLTFTLPNEYTKFVAVYAKDDEQQCKKLWICKPVDLSRGRGIFIIKELCHLTYDTNMVVQRYLDDPYLISGYKFDMRCYVVVRSFQPLVIYMYEEGMARFATKKYNNQDLGNVFSHLTNTSINKFSPDLENNKEEVGPGCKWTLLKLRQYFEGRGISYDAIWKKIQSIVILTLLPMAPNVSPHTYSCFELFGFDIILDRHLKPWLLEVNLSPALSVDEDTDILVKKPLLRDIVDLTFLTPADGQLAKQDSEKDSRKTRKPLAKSIPSDTKKKRDSFDKKLYPLKSGNFKRIFPFNSLTESTPLKVGQASIGMTIHE